ncbi:hypothetical protein EDC30_1233 [Paucimonas lemoignei]|uniref:Uncharacterized protein n=1 Tax=Paucimonas lemoignei TaxID=29443 RepID=A0A4V2UI39_PAULE|nr:hypothetical protein EDC30_1233 [Paucimonas lemoignei]
MIIGCSSNDSTSAACCMLSPTREQPNLSLNTETRHQAAASRRLARSC